MFSWLLDLIVFVYLSYSYNAPLSITSARRSSVGSYVQLFEIFTRPTAQFTLCEFNCPYSSSSSSSSSSSTVTCVNSPSSSWTPSSPPPPLSFSPCVPPNALAFAWLGILRWQKTMDIQCPFQHGKKYCFTDLWYFIRLWLYEHLFHEDLVKWGPVVRSWDWQTDGDG